MMLPSARHRLLLTVSLALTIVQCAASGQPAPGEHRKARSNWHHGGLAAFRTRGEAAAQQMQAAFGQGDGSVLDDLVHTVLEGPSKLSEFDGRVGQFGPSNVPALASATPREHAQGQARLLGKLSTSHLYGRDIDERSVGGGGGGDDPALNNEKLHANVARGVATLQSSTGDPTEFLDLADLVNVFVGTEANNNPGNAMPGASVPFGMAKITVDVDQYAPAGYVSNVTGLVRGMSYLHDSGTGSSSGSYGNFESLPISCPGNDFNRCKVLLDDRKRKRKAGRDEGSPGYFSLTLDNGIKMETTATAKSALLRYTYPKDAGTPFVVQDWTNDLPGTFRGGRIDFDFDKGQIKLNGSWASSFGSGIYTYDAFACVDTSNGGKQSLDKAGLFQGDRFGQDTKLLGVGHANLTRNSIGGQPTQAGALFSFKKFPKNKDGDAEITLRVGLSFNSADQACRTAQSEIGDQWNFDGVAKQARDAWNTKLNRIQLDPKTNPRIAELFYSSLYYGFLTPNNATGDAGRYFPKGHAAPYYASLYALWDGFRTFYPLLSLTSSRDYADVVENLVDAWRQNGWVPECRANNVPGLTQGGSHGVMLIADFLAKYGDAVKNKLLPGNIEDAFQAVYKDAYVTPADWNNYGRQISVYAQYGYIPFGVFDTYSTGRQTREASRTLEYAHNDFGARNVALVAGHQDVADALGKRSLNYRNTFDKSLSNMGFSNFVQQRRPDGTFRRVDPTTCSPIDNSDHACSLQQENNYGVYETSSWEYSFYAPHDTAGLIELLTGQKHTSQGARDLFIRRLDKFFDAKLFYPGNEPSFQTPAMYHYANAPTKSVKQIRKVVYDNFNITTGGLPGNSDQGATNTLLLFHLLGLYPVPTTKEFLILSPFMPGYNLRNDLLGNTKINVENFDDRTLQREIPQGARAYVDKVLINGKEHSSRCKIQFDEIFGEAPAGEKTRIITLVMTDDESRANSCGSGDDALPASLSTGGFRTF